MRLISLVHWHHLQSAIHSLVPSLDLRVDKILRDVDEKTEFLLLNYSFLLIENSQIADLRLQCNRN